MKSFRGQQRKNKGPSLSTRFRATGGKISRSPLREGKSFAHCTEGRNGHSPMASPSCAAHDNTTRTSSTNSNGRTPFAGKEHRRTREVEGDVWTPDSNRMLVGRRRFNFLGGTLGRTPVARSRPSAQRSPPSSTTLGRTFIAQLAHAATGLRNGWFKRLPLRVFLKMAPTSFAAVPFVIRRDRRKAYLKLECL